MKGSGAPNQAPPDKVLVRGVNWLGDAVMTTPALCRLREHFPAAQISLLSPSWLAPIWEHHPAINSILESTPGESPLRVGRRLRLQKFDLALVLPNSPRSAIETWLAGIPRRIGYARRWRNWFLTERIAPRGQAVSMRKRSAREIRQLSAEDPLLVAQGVTFEPAAHQVYEYLTLISALGGDPSPVPPKLVITPSEAKAAEAKFHLTALARAGHLLLGLNPGAEYGPAKRWPVERFAAAARAIHARTNAAFLIFGGQSDISLAASLEAALREPNPGAAKQSIPSLNLCGQTTLRELMALLTHCDMLLTNDTGPMHVAAALGTPVLAFFGSTAPGLTGPGLPGGAMHRLLQTPTPCAPCFRRVCPIDFRCMTGLSVERVADETLRALTSQKTKTPVSPKC
jgi:heptosyltransferase-2